MASNLNKPDSSPEPTLEFKPSLKTYPKMRPLCKHCGDTFSAARRKAGYSLCL